MFGSEEVSGSEEAPTPATASQSALSNETDNAYLTPAPQTGVPTSVADHPNKWCVEGQYQIYTDAKMPNDKRFMTCTLTLERRVLTGGPFTMPDIYDLFTRHRLEWTDRDVGRSSEKSV